MKHILLVLLIVGLVGCNNASRSYDDKQVSVKYGEGLTIRVIDNCEYVIFSGNNSGDLAMVHHGNCHNPEHKGLPKYTTETGLIGFDSYTEFANYCDSFFAKRQKQQK